MGSLEASQLDRRTLQVAGHRQTVRGARQGVGTLHQPQELEVQLGSREDNNL